MFILFYSSVSTPTPSNATSNTPELNNLQQNGGNSTQDANNSQLEPMQEMVSEFHPFTNVVKTTIHTMATTLNCRTAHGAGGSGGKHISITVRAIYLKAPGPFQKFLAPVLKDQMSVCSLAVAAAATNLASQKHIY